MNEVKQPKKPLIYYYVIVLLVLMLLTSWLCPGYCSGRCGRWITVLLFP